ncbi:hypothetical protein K438DRAFT_2155475 [Mycena galopus ATCC 62051]|nr:hypothetical protein K438DRAFT_2155475 [Mycena galopus ATCC 62051]
MSVETIAKMSPHTSTTMYSKECKALRYDDVVETLALLEALFSEVLGRLPTQDQRKRSWGPLMWHKWPASNSNLPYLHQVSAGALRRHCEDHLEIIYRSRSRRRGVGRREEVQTLIPVAQGRDGTVIVRPSNRSGRVVRSLVIILKRKMFNCVKSGSNPKPSLSFALTKAAQGSAEQIGSVFEVFAELSKTSKDHKDLAKPKDVRSLQRRVPEDLCKVLNNLEFSPEFSTNSFEERNKSTYFCIGNTISIYGRVEDTKACNSKRVAQGSHCLMDLRDGGCRDKESSNQIRLWSDVKACCDGAARDVDNEASKEDWKTRFERGRDNKP